MDYKNISLRRTAKISIQIAAAVAGPQSLLRDVNGLSAATSDHDIVYICRTGREGRLLNLFIVINN